MIEPYGYIKRLMFNSCVCQCVGGWVCLTVTLSLGKFEDGINYKLSLNFVDIVTIETVP